MLSRATVTAASRIMLPTYVIFSTFLGLNYLLAPMSRLQGPAFETARITLGMRVWGAVFVATAIVLLVAMLHGQREVAIAALCFGAAVYVMWSIFFLISIVRNDLVSPAAFTWPLFVAVAHVASVSSLMRDEVQP